MDDLFKLLGEFVAGAIFFLLVGFIIVCSALGAAEIFGSGGDSITYKVQIKCDDFESYINYKYRSEEEIINYVDDYDCKSIVVTNIEGDTIFLRK